MDVFGIRDIIPSDTTGLQTSAEPYLVALSERYADRGLAKAVRDTADEQKQREAETRALDPDAYRLSTMSAAAVTGIYKHGRDTMSANDLLRYFGETRARHVQNADFSGNTGMDVCEGAPTKDARVALTVSNESGRLPTVLTRAKKLSGALTKRILASAPAWFDATRADAHKERTRFPVSAFAAVLAVATSLMLIVASSVLLTRAEGNISRLNRQISQASAEAEKLHSDFAVQNNLLEIRRIAIEEYGMVEEDYLKTDYLTLSAEDSVETFEGERDEGVSLSALLSAIGIGRED